MTRLTIYFGILLILTGLISYFATGQQSVTALIPSFFGIAILILGLLSLREKFRKTGMPGAVIFALLGFLGTVSGIPKLITLLVGGDVTRPVAVIIQSFMAILCLIYLVFGIKSFIDARIKSQQAE